MRNVGGIAQTEAQKSSDLYMKCRYLDEITGGKGIVFATGTPVSNSMVELYTMQRYLQFNELEKMGLEFFDSWASTFGETVTAIELSPEGTGYRNKTRFAKFHNLPELMSLFKEIADIQTSDTLNLPVPKAIFKNRVVINYKYVGNIQSVSYKVPINRVYFPIENKICVECDKEYTPKSNVQKYCLECKKIIRRKQQNESKRKSREKAKLKEKCA